MAWALRESPVEAELMQQDIFDVPVYRVSKERYERECAAHIAKEMSKPRVVALVATNPAFAMHYKDRLWVAYGGAWLFNEIIGYIRLRRLGNQIRGEWWIVDAKRITRTRRKRFRYDHWKLAPEHRLPVNASNSEIWETILQYLEVCKRERVLKNRFVDTGYLERLGPHVDWRAVFGRDVS